MKPSIIYCDLDGVLADMQGEYERLTGIDVRGSTMLKTEDFWPPIQNEYDSGKRWVRELPMMADARVLWDFISPYGPTILTSTGGDHIKTIREEKREWVHFYLGEEVSVLFTEFAEDKKKYSGIGCILIDDFHASLGPWREAGGVAILHTSAVDTIEQLKKILETE